MPIQPHLYLDTNVILDAHYKRWQPAVALMERIEKEQWKCITSRLTLLEWLDTEHEQLFIDNLLADGYLLSKVRDLLGVRRQEKWGLKRRELDTIYTKLHKYLTREFPFVSFEYPLTVSFWDKADDYCSTTNIFFADAMHLALAKESGCNILVTRDQDFRRIADDFILAVLPEQIDIALTKLSRNSK